MPNDPLSVAGSPYTRGRIGKRVRRMFGPFAIAAIASGVGLVCALPAHGQTQPPLGGVSIVGRYRGGEKLKLMVDYVKGASGDSITEIIARDLRYSDRFEMLPSGTPPGQTGAMNYALFAQLGAQGVVQAAVLPSGWLRVELHDVVTKSVLNKEDFPIQGTPGPGNREWRMAVHRASDTIEEWITGQRGIAQTQIAYGRDNRLWLVDSDGANPHPVTPSGQFAKWTPNGRALVYNINNDGDVSPIMVTDIATGAQRRLTSLRSSVGQDFAPVVTPDGRNIVFARNTPNGTDLWTMSLTGGNPTRVTSSKGKDSQSPTMSPDGRRIAFSSNRTGNVDVYVSDADGTNIELLTPGGTGEKQHDTPDWSPDGKFVAYQSGVGTSQQIFVLNVRDQTTRQITENWRNDDPSWAPDSRHLVVTSNRGGNAQLWVIDTQSGISRQLTRGSATRNAAWSPRLTGTP